MKTKKRVGSKVVFCEHVWINPIRGKDDTMYACATEGCDARFIRWTPDLNDLDILVRTYNALARRFGHVPTLKELEETGWESLVETRNIGRKGMEELVSEMAKLGFTLTPPEPLP